MEETDTVDNAAITQFEMEAIEYLGGFVLFKAKSHFPAVFPVIQFMTQPSPQGKLIKAI